jgi:DNA-binding GntR family transcriptional regulator
MENNSDVLGLSAPSTRTLSDHIADELRESIVTGKLKPGQRIVEQQIADAMQTSRGPVRDAIRVLEQEGLTIHYPHRGTFVARLTLEDAQEIYSLRLALELLMADYAVVHATDEQLQALDELVQAMERRARGDYSQFDATDIDMDFHRMMCRISDHQRAMEAWEALESQIRLLVLSHRTSDPSDFRDTGPTWHREIVRALHDRDRELVRAKIRHHVAASFQTVANGFKGKVKTLESGTPSSTADFVELLIS